jgi:hypothetical protein
VDLSPRDHRIIEFVAAFGQLTGGHLARLVFHENKGDSPRDRVLRRLVTKHVLAYVEKRQVGGWRSGSAQYVYQLGSAGRKLCDERRYRGNCTSINKHDLGIADVYVLLVEAERSGRLTLKDFITEPDCHEIIGRETLTPDARVELGDSSYWLELDMGTERSPQLIEKCQRYWHAYQHMPEGFPTVLFVVPDADRVRFIHGVVQGGPEKAWELFRVVELSEFIHNLF